MVRTENKQKLLLGNQGSDCSENDHPRKTALLQGKSGWRRIFPRSISHHYFHAQRNNVEHMIEAIIQGAVQGTKECQFDREHTRIQDCILDIMVEIGFKDEV